MIRVILNVPSAANCQGDVREFHIVWRVVALGEVLQHCTDLACVYLCSCRCPYAGCGNLIALTMEDLVENAELRAHINNQSTVTDTQT